MEYVVEGNPETILKMVRGYFESEEWPYRKKSKILGSVLSNDRVTCVVDQPPNPWGCVVWLMLAVVTLGTAILLWLYWWMLERDSILPQVVVTAYPETPGVSRVSVVSEKRPEYAEPVMEWMQRELVEGKRAADRRVPNTDIPEQIKRLAELRDAGAITADEFEAKKRELLDRL